MYVSFLDYQKFARGEVLTEVEYTRCSYYVDALIDDLTLDRVGRAVRNGEELPDSVQAAYCELVAGYEELTGESQPVQSFSNGVDSYTFASGEGAGATGVVDRAIRMLPVEWISGSVRYEGGNRAC